MGFLDLQIACQGRRFQSMNGGRRTRSFISADDVCVCWLRRDTRRAASLCWTSSGINCLQGTSSIRAIHMPSCRGRVEAPTRKWRFACWSFCLPTYGSSARTWKILQSWFRHPNSTGRSRRAPGDAHRHSKRDITERRHLSPNISRTGQGQLRHGLALQQSI